MIAIRGRLLCSLT